MAEKYYPEICVWELTLKCNMRCLHCGSRAGSERPDELSIDECLHIADDLLDLGCKRITFIGGEVFLYNGWEKIARRMADGGAAVNIISNGYMLKEHQIDQIKFAKLANVGISLDGAKASHDNVRNVKGSFDKAINAINNLMDAGISVGVVTSLLECNYNDLNDIYEILADLDVPIWQIQVVTAMGNIADKKSLMLNPDKIPSITKFIREKRNDRKVRLYAGDDIGYFDENELYIRNRPGTLSVWQGCQAGMRVVGIDSVGNVKGCESLYDDKFIEGNLRQESLSDIWHKDGNFAYNRDFDIASLTGACARCDKATVCRGGCRSSNHFTSGTLFENEYCCYPGKACQA